MKWFSTLKSVPPSLFLFSSPYIYLFCQGINMVLKGAASTEHQINNSKFRNLIDSRTILICSKDKADCYLKNVTDEVWPNFYRTFFFSRNILSTFSRRKFFCTNIVIRSCKKDEQISLEAFFFCIL